jgi:hypothetical protein
MRTQADPLPRETLKRARRVSGRARTLTRRDIARIRATERRQGEQAFAALLATRPDSQHVTAY